MTMELQQRRTSTAKSSSRHPLNTRTNIDRKSIRRRKRSSDPCPSRAAFIGTLLFSSVTIPLVLITRRLRKASNIGSNTEGVSSSTNDDNNNGSRILLKWKSPHKQAAINPAKIPTLDDLEAEERANQREARYQSLYQPKFDKSSLGYDIYNCPITPTKDYPKAWKSTDVLSNWNPNDVVTTSQRDVYQGLCIFDYQTQYSAALNYRNLEKPFIIRNDPRVTAVARRWGDDPEYLHRVFGDVKEYRTERSPSNQFMYYRIRGKHHPKGYTPPPNDEIEMTFGEWLEHAIERDGIALGDQDLIEKSKALKDRRMSLTKQHDQSADEDPGEDPLVADELEVDETKVNDSDSEGAKEGIYYYFRLNADIRSDKKESKFIYKELPFFNPRKKKESQFYIVNPLEERGINCRFGMRGITAANHFDMSRNTIAILGGERRYVLAAPSQCKNMALYPRNHPSLRHSSFDWSNPDEWEDHPEFKDALINEVVLHEGDVLYLPTNWFHFIVNLSLNYQCNARSGTTFESSNEIEDCGFNMPSS